VADFSGRSKPRTAIPNQSEPGATDRDGPTIVFLGRLDESRKGLPVLTAAVPLVLAQVPSAKFLIVGNGTAGQARMEAELGENRRAVTFLGQVTDAEKAELLQAADIYVAPQTGGESFGIVLIEAMSAGTAIVASDLPAFQEVLANGRAGFLFPTGETQALASKILEVWAHPSAAERKCAFAATWVKQYDWPEIATKLEGVYAEVLSRSSR
jgi:phosphatidylinositol alpha-mannosyltransferase